MSGDGFTPGWPDSLGIRPVAVGGLRLWLDGGSLIRLRADCPDHVWRHDLCKARRHDKRTFRMRTVIDNFTQACPANWMNRRRRSADVIDVLSGLLMAPEAFGSISAQPPSCPVFTSFN